MMNKHGMFIFLLLIGLGCSSPSLHAAKENRISIQTDTIQLPEPIDFEKLKTLYDTLIPIMDGLFVTYDSFDFSTYDKMIAKFYPITKLKTREDTVRTLIHRLEDGLDGYSIKTKKWGVIDSSNRVVVPFVCDGVREIEPSKGVFSIYKGSRSLNTGLPRYRYSGYYYFFDRNGLVKEEGKLFDIVTVFVADFHHEKFVIENGPTFYLPMEYIKMHPKFRGAASREYPYR
jgi:hypothetical protein